MANKGCLLLLCFLFIISVGCVRTKFVASERNHTFSAPVKGFTLFDWRHKGNVIAEWDQDSDPSVVWYRYKERAHIDIKTGDLTLLMKKGDDGLFKGQFLVNGVLQYFEHSITVIDPVSVPKVTCEYNDTHITLNCSLDPNVTAEFSWNVPNESSRVGSSVTFTKTKDDLIYYCTANNSVSRETTEFKVKTCFEEDPHAAIPGGVIAAIIIFVIIVLGAILAGVLYIIHKIKMDSSAVTTGERAQYKKTDTIESDPKPDVENEQPSNNHNL